MPIRVQDERRQPFHIVDKLVTWYWLPFVGQTGYSLYNLYISLVNYKTQGAYPSIRNVAEFLGISENTVRKYNRLLVKYGLIRIEQRRDDETGGQKSHMYYILDPPPLPSGLRKQYDKVKLVQSDFMETKALGQERATDPQSSEENINDGPLQSLKGGLQSVKSPPSTIEESPPQPLHPKEKNRNKKKLQNNSTDTSNVVASNNISDLYESLRDLGVHHRSAQSLLEKYPNQTVRRVLNFVSRRLEEGWQPERSPAAWIVAALRDAYDLSPQNDEEARQTKAQAQKAAHLKETIKQQRHQQAEDYQKQRTQKLKQLGISPKTDELWQQVQEGLKEQQVWSPALHLAFLSEVSQDKAKLVTEYPIVRQRLVTKERLRAIRKALYDATGVWLSVEVENI